MYSEKEEIEKGLGYVFLSNENWYSNPKNNCDKENKRFFENQNYKILKIIIESLGFEHYLDAHGLDTGIWFAIYTMLQDNDYYYSGYIFNVEKFIRDLNAVLEKTSPCYSEVLCKKEIFTKEIPSVGF